MIKEGGNKTSGSNRKRCSVNPVTSHIPITRFHHRPLPSGAFALHWQTRIRARSENRIPADRPLSRASLQSPCACPSRSRPSTPWSPHSPQTSGPLKHERTRSSVSASKDPLISMRRPLLKTTVSNDAVAVAALASEGPGACISTASKRPLTSVPHIRVRYASRVAIRTPRLSRTNKAASARLRRCLIPARTPTSPMPHRLLSRIRLQDGWL